MYVLLVTQYVDIFYSTTPVLCMYAAEEAEVL